MDTLQDMQKWVNKGTFRTIKINPHCSGVRVTLTDGPSYDKEVTSVDKSLTEAFNECLKALPMHEARWKSNDLAKLKESEKKTAQELKEIQAQIKEMNE